MSASMGRMPQTPELITVGVIARHRKYLYPLSYATIERMCRLKVFKTAVKLGIGKRAHWWVEATEVLAYKMNRHATQLQED